MQYNITILKQITRMLTVSILYFIIFSTVLIIYNKTFTAPYCLLGIPVILICFLIIERYVYQVFLYFCLHIIFFIPVLLIPFPTKYYTYLYAFMLVMENLHAIYIWKYNVDKPYNDVPWEIFFLLELVYLVAAANHYTPVVNIIFYCGVLLLILHFIRHYIEGIHTVIIKSQNATSVPTKKIIFTGTLMVGFVLSVFFSLALTIRYFNVDHYMYEVGKFIGELILAFLKGLLYIGTLIRAYFASDRHIDEEAAREAYQSALNGIFHDMSDPSLLVRIIMGCLTLFVYALFIYLLYQGFRVVYRIFLKRYAKDYDVVTTLHKTADVSRKQGDTSTLLKKVRKTFFLDNRGKLRQIYKTTIRSHKKYSHKKSNTPTDIENQILTLYDEDIKTLTSLYEKARYSNEEITSQDVKKGGIL